MAYEYVKQYYGKSLIAVNFLILSYFFHEERLAAIALNAFCICVICSVKGSEKLVSLDKSKLPPVIPEQLCFHPLVLSEFSV